MGPVGGVRRHGRDRGLERPLLVDELRVDGRAQQGRERRALDGGAVAADEGRQPDAAELEVVEVEHALAPRVEALDARRADGADHEAAVAGDDVVGLLPGRLGALRLGARLELGEALALQVLARRRCGPLLRRVWCARFRESEVQGGQQQQDGQRRDRLEGIQGHC